MMFFYGFFSTDFIYEITLILTLMKFTLPYHTRRLLDAFCSTCVTKNTRLLTLQNFESSTPTTPYQPTIQPI